MTTPTSNTIPVVIFGCNASDDAWACGIPTSIGDTQKASIFRKTYAAIVKAKAALDTNPAWDCIAVSSDITCKALDDALAPSDLWRTGNETFLVYQFGGVYLRLPEDNRQADIELRPHSKTARQFRHGLAQ